MNLSTPGRGSHPVCGEEVMGMDDVDVNVGCLFVNSISNLEERMGQE